MDVNGSPEFALTWKTWDMPAGEPICALRASERRTGGNGFTGWPTCSARDWKDTPGMSATGINPDGTERTRLDQLPRVAALAGWATPRATDAKCGTEYTPNCEGKDLAKDASLCGWATPNASDGKTGVTTGQGKHLARDARLAGWATPRAQDCRGERPETVNARKARGMDGGAVNLSTQAFGAGSTSSPAATEKRGVLNPNMSRWLMGLPLSWTLCGMLAFLKTRSNRRSAHSRSSSTGSGA
jgi:hypothetical protein